LKGAYDKADKAFGARPGQYPIKLVINGASLSEFPFTFTILFFCFKVHYGKQQDERW
jgi:hypothetical protein